MNSLFLALGLLVLLALAFAGIRAWLGQRAFAAWFDFFAEVSGGPPSPATQRAAQSAARTRENFERRFAALSVPSTPLRAWLQLREADTNNHLTDRIDAVLRARPDLDASLARLLESPLRLDRGLALRHLGLAENLSAHTASAALEAVELLTRELRDDRALRGAKSEQLQPLLFGAAQACETLRERGHFVETAARDLRAAVASLGREAELDYVVATLDHALAR